MPAQVKSAFDVALWFFDHALNQNEYLQPQKLQRLLFLAQSYYAVAFPKGKLMPAYFVADEMGPTEPNIYQAFVKGRPNVEGEIFLPVEVEDFLDSIWRRFGHYSAEHLTRMTKTSPAYAQAFKKAPRAEITLNAMRLAIARSYEEVPAIDQVVRPKIMRSQDGKPVAVSNWNPNSKPVKRKTQSGKSVTVTAWVPGAKPAGRK